MTTVRDALIASIRHAGAGRDGEQKPASAILWPDSSGIWAPIIDDLSGDLEILSFGDYDQSLSQGPAIWLRVRVAGLELDNERSNPPVVYLPGVSREQFRRLEECPDELKPLAELQYRGAFWTQSNGRDWTPHAFLRNPDHGLGIDVKSDQAAQKALAETLPALLDRSVEWLANRAPVDASAFYDMLEGDPMRTLLLWIGDPETLSQLQSAEVAAFRSTCQETYGLDVDNDGPIEAARRLALAEGAWRAPWRRFRESPDVFLGVENRLRQAASMGQSELALGLSGNDPVHAWPQHNESEEASLRTDLTRAAGLERVELVETLARLESAHGIRRSWVWADLGQSPLANALENLQLLATSTPPVKKGPVLDLHRWYEADGWRVDDAVMRAMACVAQAPDREAVAGIVKSLYVPWVDHAARTFQSAVAANPSDYTAHDASQDTPGLCTLFVDGLRLDVGHRVAIELRERRYTVEVDTHLAALPTITATAKPAVAPGGIEFEAGDGLEPLTDGKKVNAAVLRAALNALEYQTLQGGEIGDTSGKAWTEAGSIDNDGHSYGIGLAARIEADVADIAARVNELLEAGWSAVRIVTDHGFLLMSEPMPKAELPAHLVEVRKGRCARLKPGGAVDFMTVPWRWDNSVEWAIAPGISCFEAGKTYEHGGVSLQECIVPAITVTRDRTLRPVELAKPQWRGMRVTVSFSGAPASIDLRTKPGDPDSSLLDGPATIGTGQAKAVVANPDVEGTAAVVVALSPSGDLLGQVPTVIGEM